MTEQEAEVMDSRGYSVVKANSIIQKSRYKLSIAEQKTIAMATAENMLETKI